MEKMENKYLKFSLVNKKKVKGKNYVVISRKDKQEKGTIYKISKSRYYRFYPSLGALFIGEELIEIGRFIIKIEEDVCNV